ncbi:MAG: type II secretion system F family protein [Propionicimonas sp.]
MTGLAAAAAFVAAWLGLARRPGLCRLDEVRQPKARAAPPWWVILTALVGAFAGTWLGGWALGVGLALVTATAAWVLRRNRRRRSAAKAELEVVRSCQLLAGLLRAGLVPASALSTAAVDAPLLAAAAAVQVLGGSVPHTLRVLSATPGHSGLGELANGWGVAVRTGASLTVTLDGLAERLAATAEIRHTVDAELAAPRATGRLLGVLPVAGVVLGFAVGGDPVAYLTGSVTGQACLVVGAALACAGLVWTELLADRHGSD